MNLWKFLMCSKVNQILKGVCDSLVLPTKKKKCAAKKKKLTHMVKICHPSTSPPPLGNANTFALMVRLRPLVFADSSILIRNFPQE